MKLVPRRYPEYYTYDEKPVVLLEPPDGGLIALAVNPWRGDFERAMRYTADLLFNRDADIEELSFEEFVTAVELYRARCNLGEGPVAAIYETIRGLIAAAEDQDRWELNAEEKALVRELSKRTNPLFDAALREQGLTPTPPPVPVMRMARIFDSMDPVPAVDRPAVRDDEREPLLRYLEGAPIVLAARGYGIDVLDRDRPAAVPMTYHTDGRWVWPGAIAYYLRNHDVPPQPGLVERARAAGFQVPDVDEDARRAAVDGINRSDTL
ncbi:hypothetical protein [Spirillospora albida]|uniref:hypothetical protein n=1 Tax=Spirillospora albida TaxID=58123 RepID=UPI00068EE9FE|nr:hypothetical protein [Spirillospora albida]